MQGPQGPLTDTLADVLARGNTSGAYDIQFSAGAAVTAAAYSVGRDTDATAQLHFNVPTGHGYEFSINDSAVVNFTKDSRVGINNISPGTVLHVGSQAFPDYNYASITTDGILIKKLYFGDTTYRAGTFSAPSASEFRLAGDSANSSYTVISFYTQNAWSAGERMRLDAPGNLVIGGTAAGTSAVKTLALSNSATAPSASTDLCHLYCADHNGVAGAAALAIYQEAALVASGDKAATHEMLVTYNGTPVWILVRDSAG